MFENLPRNRKTKKMDLSKKDKVKIILWCSPNNFTKRSSWIRRDLQYEERSVHFFKILFVT
jgi:hypothetical protein